MISLRIAVLSLATLSGLSSTATARAQSGYSCPDIIARPLLRDGLPTDSLRIYCSGTHGQRLIGAVGNRIDPSFFASPGTLGFAYDVDATPEGGMLFFGRVGGSSAPGAVVRFKPGENRLDSTFSGSAGVLINTVPEGTPRLVLPLPGDSVLVFSSEPIRLTPTGQIDTGARLDRAPQCTRPDGSSRERSGLRAYDGTGGFFITCGYSVTRFTAQGRIDRSFGQQGTLSLAMTAAGRGLDTTETRVSMSYDRRRQRHIAVFPNDAAPADLVAAITRFGALDVTFGQSGVLRLERESVCRQLDTGLNSHGRGYTPLVLGDGSMLMATGVPGGVAFVRLLELTRFGGQSFTCPPTPGHHATITSTLPA